jgi:hypothetical protein
MASAGYEARLLEALMKFLSALLLLSLLPLSAAVAQELPAGRGPQYDPRSGVGSFDLLTYVDGEAIVYLKDTGIRYLLLSGSPLQNAGSNYSQPIPHAVFGEFNMEKIAGRGSVTLVETPTGVNNFTAVVRINDDKAGRELYHIRLTWTWNPANPSRSPYNGYGGGGRQDERYDSRNDSRYDNRGDNRENREGLFEFKGRVDGVTVLHIHGDQVRVENVSGQPLREQTFRFSGPLPTTGVREVELTELVGRGRIELVEKPWDGNRYTAVVRITDSTPGNGQYSFKLAWRR